MLFCGFLPLFRILEIKTAKPKFNRKLVNGKRKYEK